MSGCRHRSRSAANQSSRPRPWRLQGHGDVELPTGQSRPISSYFITIAASASGKHRRTARHCGPLASAKIAFEPNMKPTFPAIRMTGISGSNSAIRFSRQEQVRKFPDQQAKRTALDLLGPAPTPPPLNPMMVCPDQPSRAWSACSRTVSLQWVRSRAKAASLLVGTACARKASCAPRRRCPACGMERLSDRVRAGDGAVDAAGKTPGRSPDASAGRG